MTMRARRVARVPRSVALAFAVPLLLMGPGLTATPSFATFSAAVSGPVTNGMIATFAWRPGAHISEELDLVVMKPDGSGAQVLVPAAAARSLCGFDLDWSPDGNRIAWASSGQVWTVKADGTDRQHLADGCVSHLDWSPDGGTLAVQIDSRTGLLSVPGNAFRWLRACEWGELGASFSPDGSRLSTVATGGCQDGEPTGWGVYGFDVADGALDARYADTNLRSQPPTSWLAAIPSSADWHPSQDTILVGMDDGSEGGNCHPIGQTGGWSNSDLFTLTPTTDSTLNKVGSTSGEFELSERDASWSPDGQRILFSGSRNVACQSSSYMRSSDELFTMNADGSAVTKVWTPWSVELGFVGSSWQPCTAVTLTCAPVPPPDADGDGLPDSGDMCPNVSGPASNGGCPVQEPPLIVGGDADGDGVQDATDSCPTVPGPLSNQGCPFVSPTLPPPPSTSTSTPVPAIIPGQMMAPSQMKAPKLIVRGTKAIVRWTAASANGSAVSKYVVDISKGKDKTVTGSVRKTVFKRLKPGRYKFRIAATNAIGTSPYSAWVNVRIR